ncbi:hypothetical protein PIB30_088217 [Stylosanthes scabra]|uniref:Uncharacterized protein n=1 Tax=Stylosanthes scabra TaxID=79078 RepID=A0ABU6XUQ9_9FABA|nr:hypothetical protein [Stylosanthes scabra]
MIGAGKNGPPGKYERWLSSASSGSVGIGYDNRPEQFFPYELEGGNCCTVMHSLNQVNRVKSLAYDNDLSG